MISGVASKGSEHSEAICTDAHVDAEDRGDAETVEEPEQEPEEGADEEDLEAPGILLSIRSIATTKTHIC